jgi:chorismate dehydratase
MSSLKISASNYSNSAPLIWSFIYGTNRGKYELILDNAPARSAELLATNQIDAALVPVIGYQLIENVKLVPSVCVGAKEQVKSVCLVTKDRNLSEVETVSLDVSSKTSFNLTKIIFREFFGKEPAYKIAKPDLNSMLAESDCALLIGDPALTVDENIYRKFDLAALWKKFTNLSFVFAMWMAHEKKTEAAKTIDFAAARDEGLAHLDEIITSYEGQVKLTREDFTKYLSENISYSVDEKMQQGMKLYFELAHKHKLIEKLKPLEFI